MNAIVEFISLFFAGMLAGIEFVIHYGLRSPAEGLEEKSQIQLRQALVRRLRWLVPAFFVPMAVSGFAATILDRTEPRFWVRFAGMIAVLTWILVRVIGTVRLNEATLTWRLDAPPKNWRAQVSKSERFHIVGTWAAVSAFVFFLTAAALGIQ
jgi:hypothetical protein